MRDPGARRPGDDVARAQLVFLVLEVRVEPLRPRRLPELESAAALEDDEDLLLRGVTVRRRPTPSGIEPHPVQAAPVGARVTGDLDERASLLLFGRADVRDVRRARTRGRQFWLAGGGLALPRVRPGRD